MTPKNHHLCKIYNPYFYSTPLYSKHSLIILNIAPNSYSEIQQVSHTMGNRPNPALLIGLQRTPVSSICFCLQRALKSHSLLQSQRWKKTNHFPRQESCKFTQRLWICCSPQPFALEITNLSKSAPRFSSSALVFIRGGSWFSSAGGPSCHLQGAVRCKPQLRHGACLNPLSLGLGVSSIDGENTEEESDNRARHEFHHGGEGKAPHWRVQGLFQ